MGFLRLLVVDVVYLLQRVTALKLVESFKESLSAFCTIVFDEAEGRVDVLVELNFMDVLVQDLSILRENSLLFDQQERFLFLLRLLFPLLPFLTL